jgi:hypothetical protein
MIFNPAAFTGDHAQEIFAEVLQANETEAKGLIRSLDNIKNEEVITTIDGDIPYTAYKEDIRESDFATYADTITFRDGKLTPQKIMALTFFKMNDLRFTRFAKDMAKGAANIGSNEFEKAVLAFTIPRLGKSFERQQWAGLTATTQAAISASADASAAAKAWAASYTAAPAGGGITVRGANMLGQVDGLLTQLIGFSSLIIQVVGTQLVISNLVDEFNKVYSVIPDEVRTATDARLYTNYTVRALILQANLARQYRDAFVVEGSGAEARFFFLGMEIEFVPLPANCIIAGRGMGSGDLISGTDLTSDHQTLEINKATMVGDLMFAKQVCSLGTLVVVPGQKVLYQG